MKDVKEAIDKLTEKVESLQADLHVAQESLEEKDQEIQELTEKLEGNKVDYPAIQEWVETEFANNFKSDILESVDESIKESAGKNDLDSIKEWINEEFAPVLEEWITEEFAPEVQNWVTEEFAPEVQNWVCEEFAPEVQGWITEEFAPEVQGWITEEFAPEVQNWITEEFAPVVDSWINEECIPENVNKIFETRKSESLSSIDSLLEAIEGNNKPNEALELLKEKQVDEKYKGVYVVENMPSEYMPQWSMVSEAKQQDIIRRSKMYDFTKQGVLESFWASVDFTELPKETINESNVDSYHANIFQRMKSLRKF
jgi:hypothetical protein